jgi:hypothetical protein
VITHVFFPSKAILTDYYEKKIRTNKDIGEYKVRLHKGGHQLELIYFEINVLDKYFNKQDIYEIKDNITGGNISNNSTYLSKFTYDKQLKLPYVYIRYGKRKLSNGNYCVSAMLKDLSELSLKEQIYWNSFEIENEFFSKIDEGFYRFVQKNFMGEWINNNDPIENLIYTIEKFNIAFKPCHVFKKTENQYLKYPINNTNKDFADSCSELFKLIDNGNIHSDNLKTILKKI